MNATFLSLPLFFEDIISCHFLIRGILILGNVNTYADGTLNIPAFLLLDFFSPKLSCPALYLRQSFPWLCASFFMITHNFNCEQTSSPLTLSFCLSSQFHIISQFILFFNFIGTYNLISNFSPSAPSYSHFLLSLDPKIIIMITSLQILLTHLSLFGFGCSPGKTFNVAEFNSAFANEYG